MPTPIKNTNPVSVGAGEHREMFLPALPLVPIVVSAGMSALAGALATNELKNPGETERFVKGALGLILGREREIEDNIVRESDHNGRNIGRSAKEVARAVRKAAASIKRYNALGATARNLNKRVDQGLAQWRALDRQRERALVRYHRLKGREQAAQRRGDTAGAERARQLAEAEVKNIKKLMTQQNLLSDRLKIMQEQLAQTLRRLDRVWQMFRLPPSN